MSFFSNLFRSKNVDENIIEQKNNEFQFFLTSPNTFNIKHCILNDYVTLWKNPSKDEIRVYKRGSLAGDGLIGFVPNNFVKPIIDHLSKEGEIEAEIKDITSSNILIFVRLLIITEEDIQRRREYKNEREDKIKTSLKKPFKPREIKTFSFSIPSNYKEEIPIDTKLRIHFNPLEKYIQDIENITFKLISNDGKYIFEASNDSNVDGMVKIIRLFYHSGFKFDIKLRYSVPPFQTSLRLMEGHIFVDITPVNVNV